MQKTIPYFRNLDSKTREIMSEKDIMNIIYNPDTTKTFYEKRKNICQEFIKIKKWLKTNNRFEPENPEKIAQLLQEAQARSDRMIEEAQTTGETEKQRLIHTATDEINQQTLAAKKAVQADLARLITLALERLLGEQVNAEINQRLLQQIISQPKD